MASTTANFALEELEQGNPKTQKLLDKVYKLRPMVNGVARRMDRYSTKAHLSYSEDNSQLLWNMTGNRSLVPKCLSLMLLGTWFRVTFFHWVYWRYLNWFYSQQDMYAVLTQCFNTNNIGFFLNNLTLIMANNQLIERTAKANIINTSPKQKPEEETISSSPSTDK